MYQIFVKSPNHHQTLTLDPSKSSTFNYIKSAIDHPSPYYLTLNGKLFDESLLSDITPLATLVLHPHLRGGGGDGGATGAESRDCYLNMYAEKKPDKVDPNEQRLSKWLNCALSNEPLTEPCVIDRLGNIFNKEALVEAMLSKKLPKQFSYIKGLKDMVNIKLSLIPGVDDSYKARFQCPITGLEFNGKYKFFTLRACGHVLSSKALKEVKSSSCLVCHKEFMESDKIVINGSEEEVALLRGVMEEGRAKSRAKKGKSDREEAITGLKRVSDIEKVTGNKKIENGGLKKFKATDLAPANSTQEMKLLLYSTGWILGGYSWNLANGPMKWQRARVCNLQLTKDCVSWHLPAKFETWILNKYPIDLPKIPDNVQG